jgi:TP901 family phage tail tape measure protein
MAVAVVDVRVDSSSAINNLRRLDQASQSSQRALDGLARQAAGIGAALIGGLAIDRIIRDVSVLDRNIRRLGTVGMDVAKISPALEKLSKDLGGVANVAELAAASYQAASAGFSDTAGNIQILNAATKAAIGGLASSEAVTEVLVKTLNAYGMSGSRAFEVTDSISKAVELGNQEWSDYTSQLGRVVSSAALAGVSIDELNAFIAAATKNGATAEVAFTGLSAVLNTLLQPTKESQTAAAKLGIAWNYGGLQARGFTGLMADLAKAMERDKETSARLLGSQEAMRGAFAANAKSGRDFRMVLEELQKASGKTDADFQTMRGSLENTVKALDTSFQDLSAALFKAFGPTIVITLRDLTKTVDKFAGAINSVPQPVLNATGETIKFIIQLTLLQKALNGIIALRAAFVAANVGMAGSMAAANTAAVAAPSAFALYTSNTQALTTAATAATPRLAALGGVLRNLAAIGAIAIAVNVAIYGFEELRKLQAELDRLRGKTPGGIPASGVFPGETREGLLRRQQQQRAQIPILEKQIAEQKAIVAVAGQFSLAGRQLQVLQARLAEAFQVINADASRLPSATQRRPQPPARQQVPPKGEAPPRTRLDMQDVIGGEILAGLQMRQAQAATQKQLQLNFATQEKLGEVEKARINYLYEYYDQQLEIKAIQQTIAKREEYRNTLVESQLRKNATAAERQIALRNVLMEEDKLRAQINVRQEGLNRLTAAHQGELIAIQQSQAKELEAGDAKVQQLQDEQDLLRARLTGNEAEVMLKQQLRDITKDMTPEQIAQAKALIDGNEALKKQLTVAEQMKSIYADIGMSIKDSVVGAIQGAIDGTKSLQEVASNLLSSIANKMLDIAVNMALFGVMEGTGTGGGLLGGLFKKRAIGGSVTAGQPYLVGEKGPELFMPGRSGGIAPAGSFGGGTNVVVNVDASGSSVQGNEAQGQALGRAMAAAVQQELIKQKRPGGLLA